MGLHWDWFSRDHDERRAMRRKRRYARKLKSLNERYQQTGQAPVDRLPDHECFGTLGSMDSQSSMGTTGTGLDGVFTSKTRKKERLKEEREQVNLWPRQSGDQCKNKPYLRSRCSNIRIAEKRKKVCFNINACACDKAEE